MVSLRTCGNVRPSRLFRAALDQCGDTLFKFLMIETSKGEDCLSHEATMKGLELAIGDLAKVLDAVDMEADCSLEEAEQASTPLPSPGM